MGLIVPCSVALRELRRRAALVMQTPGPFESTVRDNL
jgi:ABC-type phosphate transport system ATPase subunit